MLEGRGSCCIEEEEAEALLAIRPEEALEVEAALPLPLTSILLALGMLRLGPCGCAGVVVDAAAVVVAVVGVAIVAVLLLLLEEAPAWMSAKAVSGTRVMWLCAATKVLLAVPLVGAGDMRLCVGCSNE